MTERPYTDDDLRAEAGLCLDSIVTLPTPEEIVRHLREAYVPSREGDDGKPTWGDLFTDEQLLDAARRIADVMTTAMPVGQWAVNLGADGLEPTEHTVQLGVDPGDGDRPQVRMHFAFHPDMTHADRDHFVVQLSKIVLRNL